MPHRLFHLRSLTIGLAPAGIAVASLYALDPQASPIAAVFTFVSVLAAVAVTLTSGRQSFERSLQEKTAELSRANAELLRSNRDLEEFARVASHDLQEPLRTICAFSQVLIKRHSHALPDEAMKLLASMQQTSERMRSLVSDLLDYSRLGEPGEEEQVELGELMDRVQQNLRSTIEASGARITWDRLPAVKGNPVQLTRVLQNLVSNALKYRALEAPRVHVSAERRSAQWILTVRDNGCGFDQKFADEVFQPFKRLHGREIPGSGIGLAACKRIIESSGGHIWADSAPGAGTAFYFTLPAPTGREKQIHAFPSSPDSKPAQAGRK